MRPSDRASKIVAWIGGIFVALFAVAAILPMFARGHMSSETVCASNLRQIGLGFYQYAQDYDGRWPGGGDHWAGAIYPYEKSTGIYKCPQDVAESSSFKAYVCSYAMSANLPGHKLTGLTDPSSTVLATDIDGTPPLDMTVAEQSSQYTDGASPNTAWGGVRMGTSATPRNPPRHDPNVMFLACDSHVKLLNPQKVSSGNDNPSPMGAQDGVHAAGAKALGAAFTLTFSER